MTNRQPNRWRYIRKIGRTLFPRFHSEDCFRSLGRRISTEAMKRSGLLKCLMQEKDEELGTRGPMYPLLHLFHAARKIDSSAINCSFPATASTRGTWLRRSRTWSSIASSVSRKFSPCIAPDIEMVDSWNCWSILFLLTGFWIVIHQVRFSVLWSIFVWNPNCFLSCSLTLSLGELGLSRTYRDNAALEIFKGRGHLCRALVFFSRSGEEFRYWQRAPSIDVVKIVSQGEEHQPISMQYFTFFPYPLPLPRYTPTSPDDARSNVFWTFFYEKTQIFIIIRTIQYHTHLPIPHREHVKPKPPGTHCKTTWKWVPPNLKPSRCQLTSRPRALTTVTSRAAS